ncbi:hypothetical protein PHMEG_00040886, partial [Phytophthora megakarya]
MIPLRTTKNRAGLHRHTSLAPLRAIATRWSSTFAIIERAVYALLPKPSVHRRITALYNHLKTFNSVCKKLKTMS